MWYGLATHNKVVKQTKVSWVNILFAVYMQTMDMEYTCNGIILFWEHYKAIGVISHGTINALYKREGEGEWKHLSVKEKGEIVSLSVVISPMIYVQCE